VARRRDRDGGVDVERATVLGRDGGEHRERHEAVHFGNVHVAQLELLVAADAGVGEPARVPRQRHVAVGGRRRSRRPADRRAAHRPQLGIDRQQRLAAGGRLRRWRRLHANVGDDARAARRQRRLAGELDVDAGDTHQVLGGALEACALIGAKHVREPDIATGGGRHKRCAINSIVGELVIVQTIVVHHIVGLDAIGIDDNHVRELNRATRQRLGRQHRVARPRNVVGDTRDKTHRTTDLELVRVQVRNNRHGTGIGGDQQADRLTGLVRARRGAEH
jgi:hypothetical protein